MDKPFDVAGIGNAIVDALVQIDDDAVLAELGAVRGRMQPVDHDGWEAAYAKVKKHRATIQSGGSCANTMATLGLLGASSRFYGQVGDDQMGALYADRIGEACGGHELVISEEHPTGKCLAIISKADAERTMFTHLGAAVHMPELGDFAETIRSSRILHVEGYLFLGEPTASRALQAIEVARSAGVTVSLDLADPSVVAAARERMWQVCTESVDITFLNAEEASLLCDDTPDAALASLGHHCETVVLKLGPRGSIVKKDGKLYPAEASPVQAVDTTGAGDTYAGGYLYGVLKGWDPARCARLASRVASLTVGQVGAVYRNRDVLAKVRAEVS